MSKDLINDFERELRAYAEGNGHWSRVEGARAALREALGLQAEATLTITAPNGDTIKCHGTKLDMLTLDRIVKAKAGV
ncbi:hypothetical protein ABIC83_002875 [Roseateles asaccharophilus]|uniref:hypothetical protein n=1 Tax=Roseateles asaccharophilus TaxID=582607 RepID=UPI003832E5BC